METTIWAQYTLKLAGERRDGLLVSEGLTVNVPVGADITPEAQAEVVRQQLQAADEVARPIVQDYLEALLQEAGVRPSGERPSPGQVGYIVDLARRLRLSRGRLAHLVQEVTTVEVAFAPQSGIVEVSQALAASLTRPQASLVLDRLKGMAAAA